MGYFRGLNDAPYRRKTINLLIDAGADPNMPSNDLDHNLSEHCVTSLSINILRRDTKMIKRLIEKNAIVSDECLHHLMNEFHTDVGAENLLYIL